MLRAESAWPLCGPTLTQDQWLALAIIHLDRVSVDQGAALWSYRNPDSENPGSTFQSAALSLVACGLVRVNDNGTLSPTFAGRVMLEVLVNTPSPARPREGQASSLR